MLICTGIGAPKLLQPIIAQPGPNPDFHEHLALCGVISMGSPLQVGFSDLKSEATRYGQDFARTMASVAPEDARVPPYRANPRRNFEHDNGGLESAGTPSIIVPVGVLMSNRPMPTEGMRQCR